KMNEIRGRIESDAAALGAQARFPQLLERNAWNVEIHRLAQRVLAEFGDAARSPPQHRIGGGRAISADHPDRLIRVEFPAHFPDEVDEMRIDRDSFVFSPVAQL